MREIRSPSFCLPEEVPSFQCHEVSIKQCSDIPLKLQSSCIQLHPGQIHWHFPLQVAKPVSINITQICSSGLSFSLTWEHQLSSNSRHKHGSSWWLHPLLLPQLLNHQVLQALPNKYFSHLFHSPTPLWILLRSLPQVSPPPSSLHPAEKGIFLKWETDHATHLPKPLHAICSVTWSFIK